MIWFQPPFFISLDRASMDAGIEDGDRGRAIPMTGEVSSDPPSVGAVSGSLTETSGEVSMPPAQVEAPPAGVEGEFCGLCLYRRQC